MMHGLILGSIRNAQFIRCLTDVQIHNQKHTCTRACLVERSVIPTRHVPSNDGKFCSKLHINEHTHTHTHKHCLPSNLITINIFRLLTVKKFEVY